MLASVILSHIGEKQVYKCLDILRNQDYPNYEICEMNGKGMTESATQNILFEKSKGDVILFTNADIYNDKDWITRHMNYYPQYDMVMGYPTSVMKALSFSNFSIKRNVLNYFMPLNEEYMQCDFDLAIRIYRYNRYNKPFTYKIDNSIYHIHDDYLSERKFFAYTFNMVLMYRRYGLIPTYDDFKNYFIYSRPPRPWRIAWIALALMYPKNKMVEFRHRFIRHE